MKKILFLIPSYKIGGTRTSLESILNTISRHNREFYVYSLSKKSPNDISFLNVFQLSSSKLTNILHTPVKLELTINNLLVLMIRILQKICFFLKVKLLEDFILKKEAKRIDKYGFDTIVAFEEQFLLQKLIKYCKCGNKISWIHSDYSRIVKNGYNESYDNVNKIVCVSEYTRSIFLKMFPQYINKTVCIYNILDVNKIRTMALESVSEFSKNVFNIVSIGRLDPVKQFSLIPEIVSKLDEKTFKKIHWYVIGDYYVPGEYEKIIKEILKYNVQKKITLLGVKKNPYKYIYNANLLVSTSLSEACPYVINESKILGVPILCNNFGSAREFILDNKYGIVTTVPLMHEYINNIVNDDKFLEQIKINLCGFSYPNKSIIHSLNCLF